MASILFILFRRLIQFEQFVAFGYSALNLDSIILIDKLHWKVI
ncbi:hypothetical protein [Clostridium perfringens]